ncbi:ankyrin repeat domain-containing protein [Aspergillus lucknowensis]|uniref:Ankyrin repeat-containing domain protein n=1 Tax=Aspergillus lucknowensis TaxID=176173 RepID=A0ABR4LKR0_9EURO
MPARRPRHQLSLCQTNRALYALLNPYLYQHNAQHPPSGCSALWAARNGATRTAQLSLDNGADITSTTEDGWTPLFLASRLGLESVVRILLDNGADPNQPAASPTPTPDSADAGAAGENEFESRSEFKFKGKDGDGDADALNAAARDILVADPEARYGCDWTPLLLASMAGHAGIASALVSSGADVEYADRIGRTALAWAVEHEHVSVVRVLLDGDGDAGARARAMANANARFGNGETALFVAVRRKNEALVELLLERGGADPNVADADGQTALHVARASGHTGIVARLLVGGADSRVENLAGWTALASAAWARDREMVGVLLAYGARDPSVLQNRWLTCAAGRFAAELIVEVHREMKTTWMAAQGFPQ